MVVTLPHSRGADCRRSSCGPRAGQAGALAATSAELRFWLRSQGNPTTSLALMLEASSGVAGEMSEPLVLHVRENQPLELSVPQVQRMTWQELVRLWKVRACPCPAA